MNDDPERSPKAKEIIDSNIVEVPIEVLCEVVFVDCILAGYAETEKENIFTFDAKLQKLIENIKETN